MPSLWHERTANRKEILESEFAMNPADSSPTKPEFEFYVVQAELHITPANSDPSRDKPSRLWHELHEAGEPF